MRLNPILDKATYDLYRRINPSCNLAGWIFWFLAVISLSTGCQVSGDEIKNNHAQADGEYLPVGAISTPLQAGPGPEFSILAELQPGDKVQILGPTSSFLSSITINAVNYQEPWLLVAKEDGQTGWIYGGALSWKTLPQLELRDRKRMQALFGGDVVKMIERYKDQFDSVLSLEDFIMAYQAGPEIRNLILQKLMDNRENGLLEAPLDLFWLNKYLPGFEIQLEEKNYHLFRNFKEWQQLAKQSVETDDDKFIELTLLIYQSDSIEYIFPSYMIQTAQHQAHSLLGRGLHLQILRQMETLIADNSPFKSEIINFKDQLVNDITDQGVTYWESEERILEELSLLLARPAAVLDQEDILALKTRLTMFDKPGLNRIVLDLRSGR